LIEFNHHKESIVATIHSTLIAGASAFTALTPLFTGKKKLLLVTDGQVGKLPTTEKIRVASVARLIDTVPAEPSQHDVMNILHAIGDWRPEMIIGVGGGNVLDVAKLLSVLLPPQAPSLSALLKGATPVRKISTLLIPSTAGTGSEATPNAILAIPEQHTKVGIISSLLLPDYVALIPELTTSMPPHIAATTGIDALCHLLECFTSTAANPLSDNAALIGLGKLLPNIEASVSQPDNLMARLEMLWASYYGGVAINHAGTHLVHALSYPLGGAWHIPHGLANAILLVPCMAHIRPDAIDKFACIWDLIPGVDTSLDPTSKSHALVEWLAGLVKRLQLTDNLATLGVPKESINTLSDAALSVQRLIKNVPCRVNRTDVQRIYQTLFPVS
jgi:Alcohol dehydrogenase, class IV